MIFDNRTTLFSAVINEFLSNAHCTEIRTAHCAEVIIVILVALDVVLTCTCGIERKVELILPAEFEAGFAHGVVAHLRTGMSFG